MSRKSNYLHILVIGPEKVGKKTFIDTYTTLLKRTKSDTDDNDNQVDLLGDEIEPAEKIVEDQKKDNQLKPEEEIIPGAVTEEEGSGISDNEGGKKARNSKPKKAEDKSDKEVIMFKVNLEENEIDQLAGEIRRQKTEFGRVDGLICMFSTTDHNSFGLVQNFVDTLDDATVTIPKALVENKVDLLTPEDAENMTPKVDKYVRGKKLRFYRSSAIEEFQILEVVEYLSEKSKVHEKEKAVARAKRPSQRKKSAKRRNSSASRFFKTMEKMLR